MSATITTHVLDTGKGCPGKNIEVKLERLAGKEWKSVGSGRTNQDGRVTDLLKTPLEQGAYRLIFETGTYQGADHFFSSVTIAFEVRDPKQHYHVPLLLSPYGYSTYRGS